MPPEFKPEFLERAIALAIANVHDGGGPFGAVIVRDGAILTEGVNRVTTSLDPTAHAEIVAIREACLKLGDFQLTGCILYTSCEPCPMCLGAIYWARPEHVYYGASAADAAAAEFDDAFIFREFAKPPRQRRIPMEQFLRDEALSAFAAWRAKIGRTTY
jgi:tRNA(Arg) A34 adenosine deaminase TadA